MRPLLSVPCALFALLALASCGPAPRVTTVPREPGTPLSELRPVGAMPYDFMWRQRVDAGWPTGKQSFEAVLQKQKGELTLLGLSPMGLPGFVLTLRPDGELRVENRMGRELPFEPAYVIADVQRVFFPWLSKPPDGFDGERSGDVAGQHVREVYDHGTLVEREFSPISPNGDTVHVSYAASGADAPTRVRLENLTRHYTLEIETFSQERL